MGRCFGGLRLVFSPVPPDPLKMCHLAEWRGGTAAKCNLLVAQVTLAANATNATKTKKPGINA